MCAFGMQDSASGKKDPIASVEHLARILESEFSSLDTLEKDLIREIRTLSDLKSNLKSVRAHFVSIRKLVAEFEKLAHAIYDINTRPVAKRNLEQMKSHFGVLDQVANKMFHNMKQSEGALRNLFVEETHALFAASEQNRKSMADIDQEARVLLSELFQLNGTLMGHNQQLQGIRSELEIIEAQKQGRPIQNKRIGF